jgi:hypothetical protein
VIPLEGYEFTALKDTEGRVHLLWGTPGEFAGLAQGEHPVLCYHFALSLDNDYLVHFATTDNFDFVPWTEREKEAVCQLVELHTQLFLEFPPEEEIYDDEGQP